MGFLTIIKYLQNLEIVLINQTPGISENVLTELKNSKQKLKIVRNINSYTNPKDDGLRMPFISKKIVLKKKGKKKKKK